MQRRILAAALVLACSAGSVLADGMAALAQPASREAQVARALDLLASWRGRGVLVVVTHQVNIAAITGSGARSAEGVLVRPGASAPWPAAARIAP